jgi:hypothetical protein
MTTASILADLHELKLVINGVTVPLTIADHSTSQPAQDVALTDPDTFHLEDGTWHICFNGRSITRKKSVGLAYIHEMLKQPHAFIPAATLWTQHNGEYAGSKSEKAFAAEGYRELGLFVQSNHGEPVVTDETRRRLLIALHEMKEDLALLQANGDNDLAFEKGQEIDKIQEYLNKASFRGHQKRFSDPTEKARKRVSNGIARAIADLEAEHPALARHLDNSIHTGKDCRYNPEAEIKWSL